MMKDYSTIKVRLILIILIIATILTIFISLNYSGSKKEISLGELTLLGESVVLEENKIFSFGIDGNNHKLILTDLGSNALELRIGEEPEIVLYFNLGDIKKADLNQDGFYETFFLLESFDEKEAKFFLQKIEEVGCIENWDCTEYGVCIEGNRRRICVELNSCETEINLPLLEELCETIEPGEYELNFTCSELGGTVCSKSETCAGKVISSIDSSFCCDEICEAY